ncbi:MAG: phenylalanine--tRNA ligase subunit alpha, partial [Deltaproteobacteria bacterium]|nr:phenylalanine--tRNA ligase subunit alpha [Deltaproteobacteria bacterium]
MIEQINQIRVEAHSQIFSALDPDALDRLRVHYMGKKGVLTTLLHQLKELTPEKRKEMGAVLNEVKTNVERDLKQRQTELKRVVLDKEISSSGSPDVSLPGHFAINSGSLHPISLVMNDIVQILKRIGFSVVTGPEVELEFYNFE